VDIPCSLRVRFPTTDGNVSSASEVMVDGGDPGVVFSTVYSEFLLGETKQIRVASGLRSLEVICPFHDNQCGIVLKGLDARVPRFASDIIENGDVWRLGHVLDGFDILGSEHVKEAGRVREEKESDRIGFTAGTEHPWKNCEHTGDPSDGFSVRREFDAGTVEPRKRVVSEAMRGRAGWRKGRVGLGSECTIAWWGKGDGQLGHGRLRGKTVGFNIHSQLCQIRMIRERIRLRVSDGNRRG
jgi:hypothetical protein